VLSQLSYAPAVLSVASRLLASPSWPATLR